MFGLLKKIFGTAQSRTLKKYSKYVSKINACEEEYQSLSDEQIVEKTNELKKRYKNGSPLEDLLVEGYALVKNACRRLCGTEVSVSGYHQKWDMIPYDVQVLGAIAMFHGAIAEMQTGEGKTLTASMPLFLHALTEKPTHLVTVNDYLAKRDCEWIGSIFNKLGLSVSYLTNDIEPHKRKEVYEADIVYGTASEFGFDYLRDNSMAMHKNEQAQRGHFFAIIDEIDSILIDEARTPLIISGPVQVSRQMYDVLKSGVSQIVKSQKDLCQRLSSEARKTLEELGFFKGSDKPSLNKKDRNLADHAFRKLWLVSKGVPRNKTLKRIKENPDLRAEIEKWETFYYSQQNREEKAAALAELFIVVDERSNEYELTDKGITLWSEFSEDTTSENDFIMIDLGYEYAKIDEDSSLEEQDKIQKKLQLKEEDAKRKERSHNLRQLFRAHLLMEKDIDYIVQDNKIVIIDENTGRPQPGRRFSDGLHQAIEAKESVKIQKETQTYATITLQNYFRLYEKMAGMTGTAMTEANEFKELYKLDVLEIPTYKPSGRKDFNDEIYMTEREKYHAILQEIQKVHGEGRPILIGTESVEVSEKLSRILRQSRLNHTVLNAKNHALEAEIIADAGKEKAITLATNMAGRGTDIKLQKDVAALGGLHVIGTTRHHSRRIDRQLRGRSGRLGDPGSSKFFISFEDSLMRLFASPRMTALLQRFRPPEGEPISAKVLNKSIETAQKRVEQRNYTIRKHTLEYDDVMNKHRKEVYDFRGEILNSDNPIEIAEELIRAFCEEKAAEFSNFEDYRQYLMEQFPVTVEEGMTEEDIIAKIIEAFHQKLEHQRIIVHTMRPESKDQPDILQEVVRNVCLRKIDSLWQEHLLSIDHLRDDVHLRAIGQKDPLMEFKHEAFQLFALFSQKIKSEITKDIFRFAMVAPEEPMEKKPLKKIELHTHKSFTPAEKKEEKQEHKSEPTLSEPKVKRNDNCPCGSNKKYKKCCGSTVKSTEAD
ncbi:MAG: preprotein translocase subunit SecA [Chlamydiota bacterium]|jgi:preprotein translocase subunit SecA